MNLFFIDYEWLPMVQEEPILTRAVLIAEDEEKAYQGFISSLKERNIKYGDVETPVKVEQQKGIITYGI